MRCIGERWRDPDEGIWEARGGPRHYVHSKAMCWVGMDRAIKIAEALGEVGALDAWGQLRDEIRDDVIEKGFDRELGAFVQAYGSRGLDASAMLLPLLGFIRADDPRMRSTVAAIQEQLTTGGLVHRYLAEDGLPGEEDAFAICSFWLADNLALQGKRDEARLLFERVCSFGNDVGLLSEEIDPRTGEQLGNLPQAFTHVALINGAFHLQKKGRSAPPPMLNRLTSDHMAAVPRISAVAFRTLLSARRRRTSIHGVRGAPSGLEGPSPPARSQPITPPSGLRSVDRRLRTNSSVNTGGLVDMTHAKGD